MTKQNMKTQTNLTFCKYMRIANQHYTIYNKIGSGNFGQVYLGIQNTINNSSKTTNSISNKYTENTHRLLDINLNKQNKMVAIKIQKQYPGKPPQLNNQINILKHIKNDKNSIGFPQVYQHGIQKSNYFLVMELLGPNLNDLMKMCGGKFTINTTIYLAMQIFQRIQFLHSKGYVSRDIKPQNFLMGIGKKSSILYMIDFGLSKPYMDQRINLHKPYRQQRDFSGTLRYASICSHLRIQHSRRDDLESICYLLIYFLLGTLPWQNNRSENLDMKQRLIIDRKIKISTSQLCEGIPMEFKNILEYCLELDYYEQPDYQFIQGQLITLHSRIDGKNFIYDWAMLGKQKIIEKLDMSLKIKPSQSMHYLDQDSIQSKSSYMTKQNNRAKYNKKNQVKWLGQSQQSSNLNAEDNIEMIK